MTSYIPKYMYIYIYTRVGVANSFPNLISIYFVFKYIPIYIIHQMCDDTMCTLVYKNNLVHTAKYVYACTHIKLRCIATILNAT